MFEVFRPNPAQQLLVFSDWLCVFLGSPFHLSATKRNTELNPRLCHIISQPLGPHAEALHPTGACRDGLAGGKSSVQRLPSRPTSKQRHSHGQHKLNQDHKKVPELPHQSRLPRLPPLHLPPPQLREGSVRTFREFSIRRVQHLQLPLARLNSPRHCFDNLGVAGALLVRAFLGLGANKHETYRHTCTH